MTCAADLAYIDDASKVSINQLLKPAAANFFTVAIGAGYLWLAIVALLASVAGLFFYLRVIVLMYMQAPELAEGPGAATAVPEASGAATLVLGVSVAVTVAFGLVPWPLLRLVADALPL